MFSSSIRLELRTKFGTISLASIGPDEVVAREPVELPSGNADVVMDVDGETFFWPVRLPDGAVPFDRTIRTSSLGEMRKGDPPS